MAELMIGSMGTLGKSRPIRVNADGGLTSSYSAQVSSTRPANTDAYEALDVVGATAAAWTFPNIGPAGGRIVITKSALRIDVAAIPSGMTSFRLYFYSATPPSALANEAAWDLPAGDRASFLGYIDLGSPADLGSTLFVQTKQDNEPFKLAADSTSLYAYLVTNGAYTPAGNSEVYTIDLHALAT